jgi:Tol biopolymer transport system component
MQAMSLVPGARFGSYEVVALIGEGGMGQVFRARDPRLQREVAIKVLPASVAHDAERLARFEREARTLASLNHPHIAHVYGLEAVGDVHGLVMELVEGPTLAERLTRGALPLDEALGVAAQMAEALEAAHEQGIVHRDLKPANVKVRPDGVVKVLDFGLAKVLEPVGGSGVAASQLPTITTPAMTQMGVVLGTAAYMSPEQAKGRPADTRTDVWAFGCVLFEMLTGRRVFAGADVADTIANVLKDAPDWGGLPPDAPAALRRLLRRCLEKDRRRRLADIADARLEIEEARESGEGPVTTTAPASAPAWWQSRAVAAGLAVAALASLAVSAWMAAKPAATAPETHVQIVTPPTSAPRSFALSPDGRRIAYVAARDGRNVLWVRSLDDGAVQSFVGTEDARTPFWSPDGRSVGFSSDALKVLDIASGAVRILASVASLTGNGGAWNGTGDVLFLPTGSGGVARVSAQGGAPAVVTRRVDGQRTHEFPWFLPDGRSFLIFADGLPAVRGVYVATLGSTDSRRVVESDGPAVFVGGRLVFVNQGRLWAQDFDLATLSVSGAPASIVGGPQDVADRVVAVAAASSADALAYRREPVGADERRLAWIDRRGAEEQSIEGGRGTGAFALSPDGSRLVLPRRVSGSGSLWMLDLRRGVLGRFTTEPGGTHPLFSRDGARVFFQRLNAGRGGILARLVSGADTDHVVVGGGRGSIPTDVSPDGQVLLFKTTAGALGDGRPGLSWDLWAVRLEADATPFPVIATPFDERDGQFSPDGRWILYQANEGTQFDIYLQPFGRAGEKLQVSVGGGAQPRWRPDGKEIFYVALDGRLMAVPVEMSGGASPVLGSPQALYATRIGPPVQPISRPYYVPSADGQRFLMSLVDEAPASPIEIILNVNARAADR